MFNPVAENIFIKEASEAPFSFEYHITEAYISWTEK